MIKNYLKTAWRNLVRYRFYSVVNIVGLFAGITFTLLISAYVWSELQVNKELRNSGQQYFLKSEWKDPNLGNDITTLGPLSKWLKEHYPHLVKNYYRWDGITSVVSKGEKHLRENIQLGDSTLLSMYGFGLLYGDSRTALVNPYSVVITNETAIKYFGKTDVVGETLSIQSFSGSLHDFIITGVLNDLRENSVTHLNDANKNTLFIPTNTFAYFGRADFDSWNNIYIPSYIELQKGVDVKNVEVAINQVIQQNASDVIRKNLTVYPVSLGSYYLQKNNGLVKGMLYTLSFTGFFILLMAIINFINMAISSSAARIKEIGVRKVMGGMKKQIILQFLTESTVLVFVATLLALCAYSFVKPLFQDLIGKPLPALSSFPLYFVFVPVAGIVLIGLMAGLYPAFVLSSIKSADAVKGKLASVKERLILRKLLVGFQFCTALVVLIAAIIISQQLSYFLNGQLGFNKEFVVSSQVPRNWTRQGVRKMETVRNEFATLTQVSSVTLSYEIPNGSNGNGPPVYKAGTDSITAVAMQSMVTDEHYLDTYQIGLQAGRFFEGTNNDSGKVILNAKAAEALGWKNPADAIGQQLKIPNDPTTFTVQGISNDFHFGSMQQKINPVIIFNVTFAIGYRYLSFKIKPGNITASIDAIQKEWARLLPGSSFEYSFMDDTLKNLYATEIQLKKAAYTATFLSIIIVLLGILGLVSMSIHKREKEISIRKVLGASVPHITLLFLKEFMLVFVIAAALACLLAYYIMKGWLNNYAYRIALTAQPFLLPVIASVLMTFLMVALQTLKAATTNPIQNLKTE